MFDASWLSYDFTTKGMHGGLRVVSELAGRLAHSDCTMYYTTINENFVKSIDDKLTSIICNDYGLPPERVVTRRPAMLSLYDTCASLLGTDRGRSFIRKFFTYRLKDKHLRDMHAYHTPIGPVPDYIHNKPGIRPFLTALDLIPIVRPEFDFGSFGAFLKEVYGSVNENTIVLCISESTRNDLLNYRRDIPFENTCVTYLGADKTTFFPNKDYREWMRIRDTYHIPFRKYFLTLNHHAAYKNLNHLLRSFQIYAESENSEAGLIIIGTHRDNTSKQQLLESYGKFPNILFVDFVSDQDLSAFYSHSMAFVYMSFYEGFGLPVLEAMQCGTPVICSNTSSLPEVIGDCGLCFDPTDVDLLCHAFYRMETDSRLRQICSGKGLKRSALFSWDTYAQQVVDAYYKYRM